MGTRAQFFVGNPEDIEGRKWLGCLAFDGHPENFSDLAKATTPDGFEAYVGVGPGKEDDFTHPARHDYPFPWDDDLFLTDYTYAFFDGRAQVTCFHGGWRDLDTLKGNPDPWGDSPDELPANVPAPRREGKKPGPDSILVVVSRREE